MNNVVLPVSVAGIIRKLNENDFEAYAVGGCVRDSLMGREPHDWDITTSALPNDVKKIFPRTFDTGIEHGTVTVLSGGGAYEVTTYRIDGIYKDSRHPESVTFSKELKEDLKRRDFTINAIAYGPVTGIVDPFHGMDDIDQGIIRCVGDPMERLSEDALRILRAVRFSAQLGFEIEEKTLSAVRQLAATLKDISAERIAAELIRLLTSPSPERIRTAYDAGITKVILPEFDEMMRTPQNNKHHLYSVGEHTIRTLMHVPPEKILRLTMLFHDIGKPAVRMTDENGRDHFKMHSAESVRIAQKIMRRLKLDNETIRGTSLLIRYHDWHLEPTEPNVRRLVNALGHEWIPSFLFVQKADLAAQSDYRRAEKAERLRKTEEVYYHIRERGDCTSLGELQINGKDIMEIGVRKGPEVGRILNAALDDVLGHHEHNNRAYLVAFVRDQIGQRGENQ